MLRSVFVGSGPQLIACAERWLARGHKLLCVVSDCPEVTGWTERTGHPRIALADVRASTLAGEPYDYLFSVVNHAILSADVLATPRRLAINYHDSPLPRYAGFNATAWAILDGRREHGVTWHEMTAEVDAGRILVQRALDIRDDDTAFTLAAKCAEAGVASFVALVERLEQAGERGELPAGAEPLPAQDFHVRSARPLGLIDVTRPSTELLALVRGLNFGPDDSWMSKPKLLLPGGLVCVSEAAWTDGAGAPGTVLGAQGRALDVCVGDGAVRLSELSTLDGAPLDARALEERYGVRAGHALPPLPGDAVASLAALDAQLTKHERFWVARLHSLRGATLPELGVGEHAEPAWVEHPWPAELAGASAERRYTALIAAFAAYLARSGESSPFDLAFASAARADAPPALAEMFAAATPFRCQVDLTAGFALLEAAVGAELAAQQKRGSYARDVVQRYHGLRAHPPTPSALRLGVRVGGGRLPALVPNSQLTLALDTEQPVVRWWFDPTAISERAVRAVVERVDVLLRAALTQPEAELGALAWLPAEERALLLDRWQDTRAPYEEDRCVHALFEAQARRTPDSVAVVFRDRSLSYRELDEQSNRVARALRAEGVGPDVLVGIAIERSLAMVVGLLGILKSGGAYVPLDPVYPRERLAMMLEDARAPVLLTQPSLADRLPAPPGEHGRVLYVDALARDEAIASGPLEPSVSPEHLAYVIFTSGSTGRPKGVMVRHRNVTNFFAGMDRALGTEPGVWLAVTSISFDISVLELFWTLARGFQVVVQEESDRASLADERPSEAVSVSSAPMGFGLFYFAADSGSAVAGKAYRLLIEGAKFADAHDFTAVWTPERHFHAFGGLYPNPAVTTAALATITARVALRAGSVVLPLHNPIRVAEEWAVIDQLSNGRVGLSFASGWHANDFALMPDNYERRRDVMLAHMDTIQRLWRGETVQVTNGLGQPTEVAVLPRPVQERPPMWIAAAGNVETFELAGRLGIHLLTNMLGQDLNDLRTKIAAYRAARKAHGHAGPGSVTVMLHTFVCEDDARARELARKPFCDYLASSFDLVKVAPWMFPAFRQPSKSALPDARFDAHSFTADDMTALLEHAFDRYFDSAGLFGTPERALAMVERLKSIGVDEVACLIDFGIDPELVLASLPHLDRLRQLANRPRSAPAATRDDYSIAEQLRTRAITHLQCTPSMARMLLSDPENGARLRGLRRLLLGGEALPAELAAQLLPMAGGALLNMYGPTETTVWSTTSTVREPGSITIGRPIANTVIRILDARGQLQPIGIAGELCIGGSGVVRGYLGRPDLTRERFVPDPYDADGLLYRTGDLARYREDGELEFLGRIDHQVKVQGYRIELGEIEAQLVRHPSVRQAVVVAHGQEGAQQLVAYLVKAGGNGTATDDPSRIAAWERLWDNAYAEAQTTEQARFNTAGWIDSFSGAPIPASAMREWLDVTRDRILALAPRRVLELGCGTGMVLYSVLDRIEHYTGLDLSASALASIARELRPDERPRVELMQRAAHHLEGTAALSADTVVVNSVVQYFPDAAYLKRVITQASALVPDGGHIFVGDVRSSAQLEAFHTWVELGHAPQHITGEELDARIRRRVEHEGELVLHEAFFHALREELPRITAVDVRLKPARARTEMSVFRYDVVLYVGSVPPSELPMSELAARALDAPDSLDAVVDALAKTPAALLLRDVPNARLVPVYEARRELKRGPVRAGELRAMLAREADKTIDPGELVARFSDYEVELAWAASGDPARFDALLRHRTHGPKGRWATPRPRVPAEAWANVPASTDDRESLLSALRGQLRERLPEYMIPRAFVLLEAFPLTPNGKIDRKALPAPQRTEHRADVPYQPPGNAIERMIAEVWQELLQVSRVGRRENIFELGANSLLTVQANQRLSALLGRKVSLVSMFRLPTVEALAAHLADDGRPPQPDKRAQQQAERKKDAAERRRELRERGAN